MFFNHFILKIVKKKEVSIRKLSDFFFEIMIFYS